MEISIISKKLLLYSLLIAIVLISIKWLFGQSNNLMKVIVCNENDNLSIYLRYINQDLLINPSSVKNITYCLSKEMPFYDRTIEYLIHPSTTFKKDISKRYMIGEIIDKENVRVGSYTIKVSSKKIQLFKNEQEVTIYKRPVKSLFDLYSNGPSKELLIIRPRSSDEIEGLLKKSDLDQQIVKNGDFLTKEY